MNALQIILPLWLIASVPFAIMLGKALKRLSRDWHDAVESGQ